MSGGEAQPFLYQWRRGLMAKTGALYGYARVSTGEQTLDSQLRELSAAGCATVAEERASGGDPSRPVLADLLDRLASGDTLVVVRLDRLGRSLLHLLETITALQARGVHFRSLGDPVDTASPQGRFTLQILGAMAEFERALIRERTMSGLAAARAEGRTGGNPGLVSGDRTMLSRLRLARRDAFLERLNRSAGDWAPDVRRLRPEMPWQDVPGGREFAPAGLAALDAAAARARSQGLRRRGAVAGIRPGTGGRAAEGRPPADAGGRDAGVTSGRHPPGDVRHARGDARADAPRTHDLVSVLRQGAP